MHKLLTSNMNLERSFTSNFEHFLRVFGNLVGDDRAWK